MLRSKFQKLNVWLLAALAATAFVAAPVNVARGEGPIPAKDDFAKSRVSERALYRVAISSDSNPVPLGRMHRWEIGVTTPGGAPVAGAKITIAGMMPDQNHAMPTSPEVTREFRNGRYLAEGMKFDRQGWWRVTLSIEANGARDTVAFSHMVGALAWAEWSDGWSDAERKILRSLWIGSLPKPPPAPSNAVADNSEAAELGLRLFFDARLSADGTVSCSTCHVPELAFTDRRKLARGIGDTIRNAPTLIGASYNPFLFWDGRRDTMWAQALAPFESPVEHGTTRARVLMVVGHDPDYRDRYTRLFGAFPDDADAAGSARAFANLGKAIAAYERTLLPGPSKFDRYVEAVLNDRRPAEGDQLAIDELAGLKIFISANQGQCIRCHNGPMFTDHQFHNIGAHIQGANATERGRADGIVQVLADPNNCLGPHSDAPAEACTELRFAKRRGAELMGAFKTPTLRFLPRTGPYMHAGQIDTLNDVLWHYRDRPLAAVGISELQPLTMGDAAFQNIEAFLRTLDGPVRTPELHLMAPE